VAAGDQQDHAAHEDDKQWRHPRLTVPEEASEGRVLDGYDLAVADEKATGVASLARVEDGVKVAAAEMRRAASTGARDT